tara:strand:+ start:456 stop:1052 length:597 start_codon:yes stop_codon:yes gene_type:complete
LKPTFERDEIEKRINKLYEEKGEINREVTDTATVQDLIYDELRNLNGALASLSADNKKEIFLKAIVDNTATTADRLGSVDERLVEVNSLLHDIKIGNRKNHVRTTVTQDDYDKYSESVNDFYVFSDADRENLNEEYDMSSKTKKVKLRSDERHIMYQALGSRVSTLRNQIGYTRINDDGKLNAEITKHEDLIKKLKNS